MPREANGTGRKGKSFQDRELAGQVRRLALQEIKEILEDKEMKDQKFRKAVVLKLTGQILPRLNEVSGLDGEPLYLPTEVMNKYGVKRTDTSTKENSK